MENMRNLTLKTGLQYGKGNDATTECDVELLDLTTAIMLNAQEAAEKMVLKPDGFPELVVSPTLLGIELTRRRIAKVGQLNGPLSRAQLGQLTAVDLQLINDRIDLLDAAAAMAGADTTGKEVADRGRIQAVSE